MNKYSLLFLFLILLSSCSKDNNSPEEIVDEVITNDEKLIGRFDGEMNAGNGNIANDIKGDFTITTSGSFLLDIKIGSITGEAQSDGSIYTISNLSGVGIFENSNLISGSVDLNNNSLILEGTYIDNTPLTISGVIVMTGEEITQLLRDALDKSSVWFTHNELCYATITINDEVLEDLGPHYEIGGFCSATYGGPQGQFGSGWFNPVDGLESKVWSQTFTLWNPLEGVYNVVTYRTAAQFIVNKNTEYSYEIVWDNGDTETGNFTSADGGAGVCFFISNSGEDCDGGSGGGGGGTVVQEIIENTLIIDYTNSDTTETGQFDFSNFCALEEGSDNIMIFGNDDSPSRIRFSTFLLNEGTYNLSDPNTIISARIIPDGRNYYLFPSGTVEVTFLERYPDNGGEIHLTFNNIHLESFFPDESGHIEFSGTIKARWEN